MAQFLFWLHFIFLFFGPFWVLKKKGVQNCLIAFLLGYLNIYFSSVGAALILMLTGGFSQGYLFLAVSLAMSGLFCLALARSRLVTTSFLPRVFEVSPLQKKLVRFGLVVFFVVAICLLFLLLTDLLSIPDTLCYKLPTAFLYLQNGDLFKHPEINDAGRLYMTPFDGYLLWTYLFRYGQDERLILFFNFLSWLALVFSIYLIAIVFKATRAAAMFASFCFGLTIIMMSQATLDFDDITVSAPGVIGALFLILFLREERRGQALFAGIGIGLAMGAKGYPALYAPAVVLLLGSFLWSRGIASCWEWVRRNFVALGLIFGTFAFFALPYPLVNYLSGGHFSFNSPLAAPANWPFRPWVAIHNLVVYNLQLLFFSLPDLLTFSTGTTRQRVVDFLNSHAMSLVPNVDGVQAYSAAVTQIFYKDINHPDLWYGFAPLAILVAVLAGFRKIWSQTARPFLWLVLFFVCWDVFFGVRGLYILGLGRYWIMPCALLFPVLAWVWDESRKPLFRALVVFLMLTTSYFALLSLFKPKILMNRYLDVGYHLTRKLERDPVRDPKLKAFLDTEPKINFAETAYGFPIFWAMRESKGQAHHFVTFRDDLANFAPLTGSNLEALDDHRSLAIDTGHVFSEGWERSQFRDYRVYFRPPPSRRNGAFGWTGGSYLLFRIQNESQDAEHFRLKVFCLDEPHAFDFEVSGIAFNDVLKEALASGNYVWTGPFSDITASMQNVPKKLRFFALALRRKGDSHFQVSDAIRVMNEK